jgi:hypothetical protein
VEKQTMIMTVMGLLLLGALGYIGYIQYGQIQQNKQMTTYATFQQGYQYGVAQLINEAAKCDLTNGVPVTYGNITLRVVALECIQMAQQRQAQQQSQR